MICLRLKLLEERILLEPFWLELLILVKRYLKKFDFLTFYLLVYWVDCNGENTEKRMRLEKILKDFEREISG